MGRPKLIFAQHLNPEILAIDGRRPAEPRVVAECTRLWRWSAVLAEEGLVFPQTFLVESPAIDGILNKLKPLVSAGVVRQTGSSADLGDLVLAKRYEYRDELELSPATAAPRTRQITAACCGCRASSVPPAPTSRSPGSTSYVRTASGSAG